VTSGKIAPQVMMTRSCTVGGAGVRVGVGAVLYMAGSFRSVCPS
jgi:hypothetical protein